MTSEESGRRHLKRKGIKVGLTSSLIAARAVERGVTVQPDTKGRLSLKVKGRTYWFDGAKSNINTTLARRCVKNKDVTSRLLRTQGVTAPKNTVFSPDQLESAWAWAQQLGTTVVKPANGQMGNQIHLRIQGFDDFEKAFRAVASSGDSILVEEFMGGSEHRVLMIYGKVAAAARRIPANVVGNGQSSIAALLEEKNRERRGSGNPAHWELPVDDETLTHLARQGLNLESIPETDARIFLRANSNVHTGGDGVDATDELTPEEIALAERAIKAIPGLKLAGLDMLLPRNGEDSEPCVLEINAYPMITGHHYPWIGEPRDTAGMLVDAMFPGGPRQGSESTSGANAPKPRQFRQLIRRLAKGLRIG